MKFFDPLITAERCERKATFKVRFPLSFKRQEPEERVALIDKLFKDPLLETKDDQQALRKRDLKLKEKQQPSPVSEKTQSTSTGSKSPEHSADIEVSAPKIQKQAKQFDFFFLRTCFRTMNEFFKTEYMEYFKQWPELQKQSLTHISRADIEQAISGYIDHMFGLKVLGNNALTRDQQSKIIQSMITFVYAHRHNKEDLFLVELKKEKYLDFTILRDCMYHYSRKA